MKAYHQGQLDFFCAIYAVINAIKLTCNLSLAPAREILAESLRRISGHPVLWQILLGNSTNHYWIIDYLLGEFCATAPFALRVSRLETYYPPIINDNSPINMDLEELMQRKDAAPAGEILGKLKFALPEKLDLDNLDHSEQDKEMPGFIGHRQLDPAKIFGPEHEAALHKENIWKRKILLPLLQAWLPSRMLFSPESKETQQRCILLRFHRYYPYYQGPIVSHWTTGANLTRDTINFFDCTANKQGIHSINLKKCAFSATCINTEQFLAVEPESIYFLEKI